jgi:hypothetical protein
MILHGQSCVRTTTIILTAAIFILSPGSAPFTAGQTTSYLYGLNPGRSEVSVQGDTITLKNDALTATWSVAGGVRRGISFSGASLERPVRLLEYPFVLVWADGKVVRPDSLHIVAPAQVEEIATDAQAARLEEHFAGKRAILRLADPESKLNITWAAILRDGDNYLRQELTIWALADAPIREVRLLDFHLPSAHVSGSVKGSPVIAGNLFLGFEHPLSECVVNGEEVRCAIRRGLPVKAGQSVTYSSVIGISPARQMRRGFLNYVERERAHPYRPFLHYNSWYDIGYGNRYDQAAALDAIRAFGEELVEKRSVRMDSFLFDDGWDDPHSLWNFTSGFPDGFTPIQIAAAKYGAAPGIWLSPWGGYDEAKEQRLRYGRQQGFEINAGGFALSGANYFARFRDVTLEFLRKYGINQFKIDGTGNVNSVFPGSAFDSDFHAAISLMEEWRRVKPDIFVNLTTGTYPSPFWLRYADSIWRGGHDHSFAGVGPWREKWITYRDADTYGGIVEKGPLFPLNSLMLHGIIYAKYAEHLADDPEHVFEHEVHDYFGTGTQLQEMYITHSLLSDADWNTLAEAANWSRRNAETLADTHWIGGDPRKLQVYGWGAWSPQKGILTLRNPSDRSQSFSLDVGQVFELPANAPRMFVAHSPWKAEEHSKFVHLTVGEPYTFTLQPFQVLTLEAIPAP